jgi:F-type H+-transporting ATPase subunit alpha
MKKVAPKLRLDLAAFRELQDFARLGTELDEAAQKQLDRGYRMVEVLKQKQFAPLTVGQEVVSILAGTSGALDDIETSRVSHFIEELLEWMKLDAPEYIANLDKTGELTDAMLEDLKEAINTYKMIYKFSYGA